MGYYNASLNVKINLVAVARLFITDYRRTMTLLVGGYCGRAPAPLTFLVHVGGAVVGVPLSHTRKNRGLV